MNYIDLHTHSTRSDGTYSPTELIQYAFEKKLSAIALTDHDTINGLDEALNFAKDKEIEVIPGIELSSIYQGKEIHILGLLIDHTSPSFREALHGFQVSRDSRNKEIIKNLQNLDIDISMEQLVKTFGDTTYTRAHMARYLSDHGYVKDINDAFHKYLGEDAPCYVPRVKNEPDNMIKLILQAGGVPILAHPLRYDLTMPQLDQLVKSLKEMGLLGLEAIYSANQWMDETNMKKLARTYQLCISGGSDFHGTNKPHIDLGTGRGNLKIPMHILDQIKGCKP
ncbi:MAG TPA: PHP domain-containing protein [Candidatus Merdenecus merdavium]|nr:PHP domain-containing protein [Candidatus Merdenecus merdavium]